MLAPHDTAIIDEVNKVTVADINPGMLEVGRERAAKRGLGELDFVEANAEAMPFDDASFDAVTIAFGIRNVTDIPAALKDIRRVLMQLINGTYSPQDPELIRPLYNSLLKTQDTAKADTYFILADFKSYAEAQKRVEAAYRDEDNWAKSAILNVACSGKFTSDRTIQQYVDEIWHLDKVVLK